MDDVHQETAAFLAWLATFDLSRPVSTVADLSDGVPLFDVLAVVDPEYFRSSRPSAQLPDNWPLRFTSLKRLFRLINQYFADVLHQPTGALEVPDLQAIAKDYNHVETLVLCRLTLAIAVQSRQNQSVIDRIQKLKEADQHALMRAIEKVMSKFAPVPEPRNNDGEISMTDDDHYYHIQSERSRVHSEKETLEKVYQALMDEHRTLQSNHDDLTLERNDALARLRETRREMDDRRHEKADVLMRAEIDRLRNDLQKSEDNLGTAEAELDKQTAIVTNLTRKVDELQEKADEAVKLKDQVDEYRHAADKLQKTENVMEKYKKKLEESADLRRHVKALEEQNASLVDKNASLEEEYRKVSAFKPLMESYKSQIVDLESKGSTRSKEIDALKYELEQARTRLKIVMEERSKDSEALELYQERVRELELAGTPRPGAKSGAARAAADYDEANGFDDLANGAAALAEYDNAQGLSGELDDAITGTTMTDLKLQVRKLQRDLEAAKTNQADASRLLVLENLLDDANRMKARYEADYLAAHREKLVLQTELEDIRSGKALGDGPEAAIALRQRLNETVDALDALRRDHTELEVKLVSQTKELTVSRSDLNLINKDQLEILATLRESVNEDKVMLEADVERLQKQIRELNDKNKMQLEQVNALLLEKVSMQTEGIGQREKMIERERDFGDLRASLSGKGLPEDTKARLLAMHEENVQLKEQLKTSNEKLLKARSFIKSQDKLFRDEQAKAGVTVGGSFDEAEESFRSQIKISQEEVNHYKRLIQDMERRYRREQELLLSTIHVMGAKTARSHLGSQQQQRAGPNSWLSQQRKNLGQSLRR